MKSKTLILRAVLLVLILAWCSLIFCMSAEPADISSDRSEGISERIIEFFASLFGIDGEDKTAVVDKFEHFLRKGAHMFSFFVLSVLTLCFAFTFDKIKSYASVLISLAFTLVYALSDEIHQIYVDGRAGRLSDVLIDMTGALVGALLVVFIRFLLSKKSKRTSVLD